MTMEQELYGRGVVAPDGSRLAVASFDSANLRYDPRAIIQTGPAEPTWSWNQVHCAWDGPVSADQHIRPVLITLAKRRALTVVRVALLLMVAGILLGVRRPGRPRVPTATTATTAALLLVLGCVVCGGSTAQAAEIPSTEMLNTLRERLLEQPDAFPHAAEIASATLRVVGNHITLESEIHTALAVAVPLPGRLPTWSPTSVTVDGQAAEMVCRRDGFLWVSLPAGVHRVVLESLLPDVTEWEWTFLLRPRRVVIDAPEWTVSGIRPNGIVESQVLFSRQRDGRRRGRLRPQGFHRDRGRRSLSRNRLGLAGADRGHALGGPRQGGLAQAATAAGRKSPDGKRDRRRRHDRSQSSRGSGT